MTRLKTLRACRSVAMGGKWGGGRLVGNYFKYWANVHETWSLI